MHLNIQMYQIKKKINGETGFQINFRLYINIFLLFVAPQIDISDITVLFL